MASLLTQFRFWLYTYERRWTNAATIKHRNFDGHIVSMHQSGSHWIKNMLAGVLADLYDLPPMKHVQDDSIIGHTKTPPAYKHIPQIVNSHSYPHGLTLRAPILHYPRYLILVRDMRASLISHYERFKGDYNGVDFSTYLRGDVRQKKFYSDIYSRIRFMNEWGKVHAHNTEKIHILRYEDMKKAPKKSLEDSCRFFGISNVTNEIITRIVNDNTQERMAKKPKNPNITTTVIRTKHNPTEDYFTPENQRFFEDTCKTYLLHDFGYGYPVKR